MAQWLHSYLTAHRIYCGFPDCAGGPRRPASRIAAVRRLLVARGHALDRRPPANKVVGFPVRKRVA